MLGQWIKIFTGKNNNTCKTFNTNHVLWQRPILEEYGKEIEYIPVEKNIPVDAISRLNQEGIPMNTHQSNYTTKIISDINELPEGNLPSSFYNNRRLSAVRPTITGKTYM